MRYEVLCVLIQLCHILNETEEFSKLCEHCSKLRKIKSFCSFYEKMCKSNSTVRALFGVFFMYSGFRNDPYNSFIKTKQKTFKIP